MNLTVLLIILLVVILFGFSGYGYRSEWPTHYYGGTSAIGILLVLLLVFLLLR